MKRQSFIILGCLLLSFKALSYEYDVYFSPHGRCESRLVKEIRKAKKSIKAVVYSLNNVEIVHALYESYKRGVEVQILTDRLQASSRSSLALFLYRMKVDIKVQSAYRMEHNKYAIFDGQMLETGSFNWTNPAQNNNSENCLFTNQKQFVRPFLKRFAQLWTLNNYANSDAYFERLAARQEEGLK